jgi:drug/metabolite transporter (DMT)-like permease
MDAPRGLIIAAFLAVYLIWGSTYLAIKVSLESLPPFLTAAGRFALAGAVLYVVGLARGEAGPTRAQWRSAALVGGLLLLGGNGGVMWAQQRVPSGLASVLIAMVPIFVVLLEALLSKQGERPTLGMAVGVLIGFAGVALLVGGGRGAPGAVDLLGALALLCSAFSWALGSVTSRKVALPPSPMMSTACQMLAGGALLAVLGLAQGEARTLDLGAVTLRSWLAVAYLTLFGSIVAFSAYVWLLKNVAPTRVATYAYVNPVVALLLGTFVLKEALHPRTLVAAGLTLVGVCVIVTAKGRAKPATPAPTPCPRPCAAGAVDG